MPSSTYADFEEFWLAFVSDHRSAANRWAHVAGVACGLTGAALSIAWLNPLPLIAGGAAFALLAIGGHPVFEGNRAKNFGRPLWATRALGRLCFRTITGAIARDLDRVSPSATEVANAA
jgi:hypothetical protein